MYSTYKTESLCCTPESLHISYMSIKKKTKNKTTTTKLASLPVGKIP